MWKIAAPPATRGPRKAPPSTQKPPPPWGDPTSLGRPHPRSRRLLRTQYEENAAQAPIVENPSAMQETRVRSLGQEDSLEEGMATHSSILAWRIPWTEKPGGLQSIESQRVRHDSPTVTITSVWTSCLVLLFLHLRMRTGFSLEKFVSSLVR